MDLNDLAMALASRNEGEKQRPEFREFEQKFNEMMATRKRPELNNPLEEELVERLVVFLRKKLGDVYEEGGVMMVIPNALVREAALRFGITEQVSAEAHIAVMGDEPTKKHDKGGYM